MKQIKPIMLALFCAVLFLNVNAGDKGNNKKNQEEHKTKSKGGKVPIDGGISLLLAAGIGYGVKRVSSKNKNKDLQTQL